MALHYRHGCLSSRMNQHIRFVLLQFDERERICDLQVIGTVAGGICGGSGHPAAGGGIRLGHS